MSAPSNHPEHRQVAELIPWYVNGTIGQPEREKVEAHVLTCEVCREDVQTERRVYESVASAPGVEYMPAASLKRLQSALDGIGAPAAQAPAPPGREVRSARWSMPWKGLAAASVAVTAVFVAFAAAGRWSMFPVRDLPPNYHTVTNAAVRPPGEVIRAVFSPTIKLADLQVLLGEAQLRIVSGPTEAGVYSLASTSSRAVSQSLGMLRSHPEVRFAESVDTDTRESP